jgi:hypothetical protein
VILRTIELPARDPRSLRQVIQLEQREFDELAATETLSRYIRLPAATGTRRALLATTRTEAITQALALPTEIGLNVTDLVPAGIALMNAFHFTVPRAARPSLCIDLAQDVTEVVMAHRESLLFARSFAQGADALATGSEEGADAWISEIESCLLLYRNQYPSPQHEPERVILSGGTGSVHGLRERLAQSLGIAVYLLEDLPRKNAGGDCTYYALALGLALAGLEMGPLRLGLLPHPLRERALLRDKLRYWLLSGVAVVLALLFAVMSSHSRLRDQRRQLSAGQSQLEAYDQLQSELDQYEVRISELEAKVAPLETAVHNGRALRAVLAAVTEAKYVDDWITLIADAHSYAQAPGLLFEDPESPLLPQDQLDPQALAIEQIVIEGYTPVEDLSTVRAMIDTLQANPAVLDADLLGDDRVREDPERDKRWAPAACRLFAVEIEVAPW